MFQEMPRMWKCSVRLLPALPAFINSAVRPITLLAQVTCVRHLKWRLQCVVGHCYYHNSVSLSFLSVFCFWPTSGKLPRLKICFPHYFGLTRRYICKKIYIYLHSVMAGWAILCPWCIFTECQTTSYQLRLSHASWLLDHLVRPFVQPQDMGIFVHCLIHIRLVFYLLHIFSNYFQHHPDLK